MRGDDPSISNLDVAVQQPFGRPVWPSHSATPIDENGYRWAEFKSVQGAGSARCSQDERQSGAIAGRVRSSRLGVRSRGLMAQSSRRHGRAMGQVLHGCAATTKAIRRAIRHIQASLRQLARRYGINPKTARNGGRATRSSISEPVRRSQDPPSCRSRKKPSRSPAAGTRCCRCMTGSTRCSRPSRT